MSTKENPLFKKYKIEKHIGSGTFGNVYRVMNLKTEKKYALKHIDNHQKNEYSIR